MKKIGVSLFVGILLLSVLSAGLWSDFVGKITGNVIEAGSEDDIILRLSSDINAHGEVYNGASGYTTDILYSDIFGTTYSGTNPHECTGDNIVLKLSSDTNAHAESPTGSTYTTDVCYGDLSCRYVSEGNCADGEQCVVTLSGETNAHLANCSSDFYTNKICCITGAEAIACNDDGTCGEGLVCNVDDNTCVRTDGQEDDDCDSNNDCVSGLCQDGTCASADTLNLFWANSKGIPYEVDKKITILDFDNFNLSLEVQNTAGVSEGDTINLEIMIYDDSIVSGDDLIKTISTEVDAEGNAEVIWEVAQEDFEDYESPYEIYFEYDGEKSQNIILEVNEDYCVLESISFCKDYVDEDSCIKDECDKSTLSVEDDSVCGKIDGNVETSCLCKWNETSEKCYGATEENTINSGTKIPSKIGTCLIDQKTDDSCDDGFLTFTWEGNFEWDGENEFTGDSLNEEDYKETSDGIYRYDPNNAYEECVADSGEITRACSNHVRLPFFTSMNIIVTLSLITFIYLFLIFKKR